MKVNIYRPGRILLTDLLTNDCKFSRTKSCNRRLHP